MTEEELFNAALAKPRDERGHFLDHACAGNAPLRTAVEALLEAHEAPGSFLNVPDANSAKHDLDQTLDSAGAREDAAATGEHTPHRSGDRDSGTTQVATTDHHRDGTPGVVIAGRFILQEKIGEGGMGEVWVAKQTEPVKRKVALKLIKPGMDSRAVLQRFEQERQALAILDHPNIARVLDGGMTPSGQPFFVMELVNGLPLTKFCDHSKLTPKERLELFVPICQAVQHAHTKGIVHRDLKPANILVTMVDGRPVPKVIDFGVAKATSGKLTEETMSTGFGAVVGTLEYMSPEQAAFSNADIDTRADIYSLGMVLYELLTGLRPIDAKRIKQAAITEMIRIIQEEEPSKPSTRLSTNDSLPSLAAMRHIEPKKLMALLRGDLDWVVMKCLEKQRDRRYETANGLARDIQRYLDGDAVEACPPSMGYRMKKFVRRNRVGVAAGLLVAAALVIAIIGTSYGLMRANTALIEKDEALAETRQTIDKYVETVENAELLKEERFKPLLKDLLTDALAHYERFVNRYDHDQEQLADLASALAGVTRISEMSGDIEKAIESCQKTIRISEQLANQFPNHPEYLYSLAADQRKSGDLYALTGRTNEALAAFLQAQQILESLAKIDLTNSLYENDLASVQVSLGSLYGNTDRPQLALDSLQQAIAILERLAERYSDNSSYQKDLAAGHQSLGDFFLTNGDPQLALSSHAKALAIYEQLREQNPTAVEYLHSIASSHANIGLSSRATGNLDKALEEYKLSIEISEKLVEENPTVSKFHDLRSTAYSELGVVYQSQGEFDKALALYETQINREESLVAEHPTVLSYRSGLAKSHHNLGLLHQMMNKPEEALASYKRALNIRKELVEEYPKVIEYLKDLAESYINFGHTYFATNQPEKALLAFQQSLDIQGRLVERYPSVTAYKKNLGMILNNIGLQYQTLGQPKEALNSYKNSLVVLESLVKKDPSSVETVILLGGNYINTANLARFSQDFELSDQYYQSGIETLGKILASNPNNPQARSFSHNGHKGRAQLMEQMERYDQAVLDWEKAIEFGTGQYRVGLTIRRDAAAAKAKSKEIDNSNPK